MSGNNKPVHIPLSKDCRDLIMIALEVMGRTALVTDVTYRGTYIAARINHKNVSLPRGKTAFMVALEAATRPAMNSNNEGRPVPGGDE